MGAELSNEQHEMIYGTPKPQASIVDALSADELKAAIIAQIMGEAPAFADHLMQSVGRIEENRSGIRDYFNRTGQIVGIPTLENRDYSIAAIDGAQLVESLYTHDLLVSAVVSADGLAGARRAPQLQPITWVDMVPRKVDNAAIARLHMLVDELRMLQMSEHSVRLIDGSHINSFIQLAAAVSSRGDIYRAGMGILRDLDVPSIIKTLTSSGEADHLVASLAKADTTTILSAEIADHIDALKNAPSVTDKALAALILENGEMLTPRSLRPENDKPNGFPINVFVSDSLKGADRALVEQFSEDLQPLRDIILKHRMQVIYAKPFGMDTAIRIQFTAPVDHDQATKEAETLTSRIVAEVAGPDMQEPFPQFVADALAKSVSTGSEALKQSLIAALPPESAEFAALILRGYRT